MDASGEIRPPRPSGNVVDAARQLVGSLWEHVGIRLELFALELAEERARLVAVLVAIAGIVVCAAMALAFAGLCVLLAAWDSAYRVEIAAAFAVGFGVIGALAWLMLRTLLDRTSPLFRHSLAEWRRDVVDLRTHAGPDA